MGLLYRDEITIIAIMIRIVKLQNLLLMNSFPWYIQERFALPETSPLAVQQLNNVKLSNHRLTKCFITCFLRHMPMYARSHQQESCASTQTLSITHAMRPK